MIMSIQSWLAEVETRLRPISDTASLDAQVLLASILNQSRSWVISHPCHILTDDQIYDLKNAASQLEKATPLAYITGRSYFYGLEFHVTPDVLIPRPETELLIEVALDWAEHHPISKILDVGTGSGCIAITLASRLPGCHVTATDISSTALAVARHNAEFHHVENRLNTIQSNLATKIDGQFQLICGNLPYIPSDALTNLAVTRSEPRIALDGGPDGLVLIRKLLQDIPRIMAADCCILLEIESSQGEAVLMLAKEILPVARCTVLKDLAGHDRLLKIERDQ